MYVLGTPSGAQIFNRSSLTIGWTLIQERILECTLLQCEYVWERKSEQGEELVLVCAVFEFV